MGTLKGSMIVADAIKDIELEKINGPSDLKVVKVGSFWENQAVLVHVLRRFGCMLCRANALELQKITPILEQNNIRVVAVGIEKLGMEEFLEGGYWKGELYIDDGKKILKALDIKSVGILSTIAMIVANKDVKDAAKKSKHIPGNFKGDGRQLGGTFAIAKGGEILMDFRQKNFADHPSIESMLEAFGIDANSYKSSGKEVANPAVCDATCSA